MSALSTRAVVRTERPHPEDVAPSHANAWPAPPRALTVGAGVAVTVGVGIAVLGAWRTGVSWDETYHVMRMRTFLEHGWYLLEQDMDGAAPGSWVDQRYVYGPVSMVLLHAWSVVWGVDAPGRVAATDQAYAVRHLGVVLIALVGLAATATITRILLRRWAWGLVSAAVLVAVPTWTGHAMFNVKDVPVATGYTLLTLGLLVVARAPRGRPGLLAGAALTTYAGLLLAVGTRPGIWVGLALSGGVVVLVALVGRQWARALLLGGVAAAALLSLTAIYPAAFDNPLTALVQGALSSADYDGKQGSWFYLPLFLTIELPTLIGLLGLGGTVLAVRHVRRPAGPDRAGRVRLGWSLVLLQTFALPLIAVARESNLYTGLRQLLFAAPGLAVLATLALAALWRWWATAEHRARVVVPVVSVLAIGAPLLVQAQLFPYSYAFSSVPANIVSPRLAADNRDLEVQSDYWRTSVRELAPQVPVGGYVVCTPRIDPDERFVARSSESRENCAVDPVGPLAPYDAERSGEWSRSPTQFLAVDAGSDFVGRNCTVLGRVTRQLWWRTVTMSSVSRCDLVLADYAAAGESGVAFDGAGSGADYLRGSWSMLRPDPGARLEASSGLVGFVLPDDLRGRALRVSGHASDVGALGAAANGARAPVDLDGTSFSFVVPADVASSYGAGQLVLTLSGPGMRLLDLRVDAVGGGES